MLNGSRTEDAFSRFELLERRADFAEGRADALGMTGPKSLEEEIADLAPRAGRQGTGSAEGARSRTRGISRGRSHHSGAGRRHAVSSACRG
jgi:phage shock protein A